MGSSLPPDLYLCLLLTSMLGSGKGSFQLNKFKQLPATKVHALGAASCELHSPVSCSEACLGLPPPSALCFCTSQRSADGAGVAGGKGCLCPAWGLLGNGWRWAYGFQAEELCSPCGTAFCPHRSSVKRDRWWLSFCSWPWPQRDSPTILECRYPQPLWLGECRLTHEASYRRFLSLAFSPIQGW